MKITEVDSKKKARDFIEVNVLMNQHNHNYIRPLDMDINDVFDPLKNKNFKQGTAKRWLLVDDSGGLLGRIAAFVNNGYVNKGTDFKTGGLGFFECIDDQLAANMLFDKAVEWLKENGMEAVDGPINFGDRDKWWGLMTSGFYQEPAYGMSFNPPYYQKLFETYRFKNFYNQYYFNILVDQPFHPKIAERHARFANKPEYRASHINIKNIEKHALDFATVYNAAWAQHGENKQIDPEDAIKIFNKLKFIIDPNMVFFAYYKEEPIGMFINIPDLNQYIKHFNGKMGWIEIIRLLIMKHNKTCKKACGLAFGVVPRYQALGIDSLMIHQAALLIQNKGWYDSYEMGWSGDWNPKMVNIYKNIGGVLSRNMVTYRYIFDEGKYPFERHPIMEYK